ncbi:hypothetical protein [Actinocorallia longicatena]|uniref:Uncharacterized protein n=1 Tax=Actinocorallia longicatena TaxID=111803 RepID=A0ABP6QHP3_9ACTN
MYQPPGSQPPPWQGGGTPPPYGPGGGAPPPYYPQGQPPRRPGGQLPVVMLVIGVVLVAVLAVVAFVVLREDDKGTPVVKPTNADVFTSAYAGKWSSTVYQKKPTTGSFVATVEITAGSATGTITYVNAPGEAAWSCSGTLTFLKRLGGSGYKTVVREHLTTKSSDKCNTFGYDVLFPKDDGTGMFLTTYVTQAGAEVDKDYYAIGTLEKQ